MYEMEHSFRTLCLRVMEVCLTDRETYVLTGCVKGEMEIRTISGLQVQ